MNAFILLSGICILLLVATHGGDLAIRAQATHICFL